MTDYAEIGRVLCQLHMGVTIADKDGVFVYVGESYLKFTGIERGWLEGRSAFDSELVERFSPCVTAMVYESREKITTVQRMCDGAELFVTGVPVFDDNGALEMIICYSSWEVTSYDHLYGTYTKAMNAENVEEAQDGMKKVRANNVKESLVCASVSTENVRHLLDIFASALRPAYIYGPEGCGKHFMSVRAYAGAAGAYEFNCALYDDAETRRMLFDDNGMIRNECGILILRGVDRLGRGVQRSLEKVISAGGLTVVAISEYPLESLKKTERISEKLYSYFRPYTVEVSPISDRREDLKVYIEYYLNMYNHMYSRNVSLSTRAKNILLCCEWKENINEVRAFMERLVLTADSERIDVYNLPGDITPGATENYIYDSTLKDMMESYEKDIITNVYNKYSTSVALAKRLGISQATAVRKIHKYVGETAI